MEGHLSPDTSDEDPATAQLLAELQASSPVVLHPLTTSAARSASLLNAARIEKRPAFAMSSSPPTASPNTLAFSSPGGMARGKIRTGKLKRPSFLGANMAKMAVEKSARRKSVYDLPQSPEKRSSVKLPERTHVKNTIPVKRGRKQEEQAQASPVERPSDFPSTPLLIQDGVLQAEEDPHSPSLSTPRPSSSSVSIKTQLSDGRTRCTRIIRSVGRDHTSEQCHNEGLLDTDAGPRCNAHVGTYQDAHVNDSHDRRNGRLSGQGAEIAATDFSKKAEAELEAPSPAKRKAGPMQPERDTPNKSPRRSMKRVEQAGAVPGNERSMRLRGEKANPQVVVTRKIPKRASKAKSGIPEDPVRDKSVNTKNMAVVPGIDEHSPATAGYREDLPNVDLFPTRKRGRPRKNKATSTEPDAPEPSLRLNRGTGAASVQKMEDLLKNHEALEPVRKSQAHAFSNRGKKKMSTPRKATKEAPPTRNTPLEEQLSSDEAEVQLDEDRLDEADEADEAHASDQEDYPEPDTHRIQQVESDGNKLDNSNDLYNGEAESEEAEEEAEERDTLPKLALDRVFAFIDSRAREGSCQTKFATKVKKLCDKGSKILLESDPSLERVAQVVRNVEDSLASVSELQSYKDRKAVKGDAFAYLFHSLIRFLEAVHSWSRHNLGEPRVSLPALRVVVPLLKHIIAFKRTITAWNVSISSRYKGDRMVRDTEKNLMDPLFECEEDYSFQLRRLEELEQAKRIRHDLDTERRYRQDEAERREEAAAAFKAREARWKHLHFIRQQCEDSIDPRRRNYLRYRKLKAAQEVDANGVPFEREPIFKDRAMPYLRPSPAPEEKAWTDKQLKALLDGLQKYAGECFIFYVIT